MNYSIPEGASLACRWLVRQLGSGQVSIDALKSLAKQHGVSEPALYDAAIEADIYRSTQEGTNAEMWSLFPEWEHKRAASAKDTQRTGVVTAAPRQPAAAAPKPSSAATSYRPPAPAPKPAGPPPLTNAQLRERMDSVLWQDSVRGRERLALALIAEPAIQADGILPALRAAPALRDEQSRKLSARIGDLAYCANSMGRERLTLHLIEQTHHSVEAAIGMLRAVARDTSAKPKTESTTELYARRAAERATARRQ